MKRWFTSYGLEHIEGNAISKELVIFFFYRLEGGGGNQRILLKLT